MLKKKEQLRHDSTTKHFFFFCIFCSMNAYSIKCKILLLLFLGAVIVFVKKYRDIDVKLSLVFVF